MPADRLVHHVVLALSQRAGPPYKPGSLLMDTPLHLNELVLRATGVIPDRREPYRRVPLGRVHLDERRLDEDQ